MNIRLPLTLALLAPLAAHSGTTTPLPAEVARSLTAAPILHVFGGRGVNQRPGTPGAKLDATLADLTNHARMAGGVHALADMRSLAPAARFMQRDADATPLVLVDAVTRGNTEQLKNALVALGLQKPSAYSNVVSGWLPVNQIDAATARAELHSMNAVMFSTRAGAVTTQGDFAQGSATLRSNSGFDGTGVTVGALSDSYNCYNYYAANGYPTSGATGYAPNGKLATAADDVNSSDLPSNVNVLVEATCQNYGAPQRPPFADEGRAMLQIIHDVAPGAGLAFYTAENGEASFANGIVYLANQAHAKVIVDDIGFFDEPFFQDGLVAQAVDSVASQGVAYFSAAGNDASNAYDNIAPAFNSAGTGSQTGEQLLNFDNTGSTTSPALTVNIPALRAGELIPLVLQWDDPFVKGAPSSPGATSQLDLCVSGTGSNLIVNSDGNSASCTGANTVGSDPIQILIVFNPANSGMTTPAETLTVKVGLVNGVAPPHHIKLAVQDNGAGATLSAPNASIHNPTIQGHPMANGAMAVGAAAFYKTPACGVSPAVLEAFSSLGGGSILFDSAGTRLSTPDLRQKPDFVAPERGNTTFFGHPLPTGADTGTVAQCADNANYPHFAGTSAAAPHAAAVAALLLQANSSLTPRQIRTALQTTASAMATPSPDYASGYGLIQADTALKAIPYMSLTLANSSVTVGTTTTLTWSSTNTTSCSASGGWTTSRATSGNATITAPSTAGNTTYSMTCVDSKGNSAKATATLTATAASKGGGGAMDQIALLVLGVTLAMRLWGRAPQRSPQSCRAKPDALRQ